MSTTISEILHEKQLAPEKRKESARGEIIILKNPPKPTVSLGDVVTLLQSQ